MGNKFEEIWKLKPEDRSKVFVYNKETKIHEEKQIYRSYRSYLNIPPKDTSIEKSWMNDELEPEVPEILHSYIEAAKKEDPRFNSLVLNFYEAEDFIEPHRDCDYWMVDNYQIRIESLGEIGDMLLTSLDGKRENSLSTENIIMMGKTMNTEFRHSVGKGKDRRISLTFRMLDLERISANSS